MDLLCTLGANEGLLAFAAELIADAKHWWTVSEPEQRVVLQQLFSLAGSIMVRRDLEPLKCAHYSG